ncbi:hypothetical protein F9L33_14465 [Amylibacter sp. SFDW26]|nr:hypothetical protein F9L33_14465 [Amylibacter sp. SFDW26]
MDSPVINSISYNEQGLPSRYDIAPVDPDVDYAKTTFEFEYRDDGQLIRRISYAQVPNGSPKWTHEFAYNSQTPPLLIRVDGTSSFGEKDQRTYTYDAQNRPMSVAQIHTTHTGENIKSSTSFTYGSDGNILSGTITNSTSADTGKFQIQYDENGLEVGSVHTVPNEGSIEAKITRSDNNKTEVQTFTGPNNTVSAQKIVSQYEVSSCRIPKLTDGFVVMALFDHPTGFNPSDACKKVVTN